MKAVIYARYSSDNQRTESIDAQIREITEYADKNGIYIVRTYKDEAYSAKTDDRPEFQRMIKDAGLGMFDAIIVHKLDRFARNRYDSAIYRNKLKNFGVVVISVREKLDNSPESVILEALLEGMNEYYSLNLAREVMKGLKENAYKCKHTGGKPPFGFDVDKDLNYIINEHEALAVRRMFSDYAGGTSYRDIISWLKNEGYVTKYGKPFQKTSLNNLLKNEKYIGVYVYNQYKRLTKNGVKINQKNDDGDIIRKEGFIPAIVSRDLFNAVQQKMTKNKENAQSVRAKEEYLLAGKLHCGACGSRMNGARRFSGRNKSLYITYQCAKWKRSGECKAGEISRNYIEREVVKHLEEVVFTDEFIAESVSKMHEQYMQSSLENTTNIATYESKLRQVEGKIDNVIEAISDVGYNEGLKRKLLEYEKQKSSLIHLVAEARTKYYRRFTVEDIAEFVNLGKDLSKKTFREKRIIIDSFVSRIEVFEREIKIHLVLDKSANFSWGRKGVDDVTTNNDGSSPLKPDNPNQIFRKETGSDLLFFRKIQNFLYEAV